MIFPATKKQLWEVYKTTCQTTLTWKSKKDDIQVAIAHLYPVDVAALRADVDELISKQIELSNRSVLWKLYNKYQFIKTINYKDVNCKEALKKWTQSHIEIEFRKKEYKYKYGKFNPFRDLKRDIRNRKEEVVEEVQAFDPFFIYGWSLKPKVIEKVIEIIVEEEKEASINIDCKIERPETRCEQAEEHKYEESLYRECVYCVLCGDIKDDDVYIISDAQKAASKLTHSETYDRGTYLIKQLLKMAGKDEQGRDIRMCEELFEMMCAELPKNPTWYDVHQVYKLAHFKKGEWMGFLSKYMPGESLHLSNTTYSRVMKLNKALQYEDNNFPPGYLVMKCMELAGEEAWKVSFKRSKAVLAKYDKRWKEVCADYEWEYIPSKLYTLKIERL